jgi:DNA polymerase III subunit epsilon
MLRWATSNISRLLLADRRYDFLFQSDRSGELVSLDCETTGFYTFWDIGSASTSGC